MSWLLIVVLVILAGNALIGMKVGFIKTVFSLCSLVVALALTVWISPVINNYLNSNEKIYEGISKGVEKMLPFAEEVAQKDQEESLIDGLSLPQSIKDTLIENNNSEVYKELAIDNFKDYVSKYLTGIIINAMSFIGTFIVILVILWAISFTLNIISKLPVLNQINKTAGLAAGVVHGLVVTWLFFILMTVFSSTVFGQEMMQMVGESQVLSIIYNNNLLLGFITSATKLLF